MFTATRMSRRIGPDFWICDCGIRDGSEKEMAKHLKAHQAYEEAVEARIKQKASQQRSTEMKQAASEELDHLRVELEAAIEKARQEGLAEGYFQGLDVAAQSANKLHAAAKRWGAAEETSTGMICHEIGELLDMAKEGRPGSE